MVMCLSRLETIPGDILHLIALFAALPFCSCSHINTSTNAATECTCCKGPTVISCLLRTSSTIYSQLSLTARPALYAELFNATFDTQAWARRYHKRAGHLRARPTSSALAAELVSRCRLLRRVRRRDLSHQSLMQDLWTALWMLLESDGANKIHLTTAGFSAFIVSVARSYLVPGLRTQSRGLDIGGSHDVFSASNAYPLNAVVIWLLCLFIRRGECPDTTRHLF